MGGYIGVDNKARAVTGAYVGVDGKARRVVKAYVGDESGKARLWYEPRIIMFTLLVPKSSPIAEAEKKSVVCQAEEGMSWYEWFLSKYLSLNCSVLLAPNQISIGILDITLDNGGTIYEPIPSLGEPYVPKDGATYDFTRTGQGSEWYKPVSVTGGEP